MSVTVRAIVDALEAWAPPAFAYDWDRPGLSMGSPDRRVSRVLVCLTLCREALEKARQLRAQIMVSHHPLIHEPLKHLRSDDPHARLCIDIARANIAVFSAHTNLDVAPGGVSHVLAERLHLLQTRPLLPAPHAAQVKLVTFVPESHLRRVRDAVCAAGAGIIGDYTHCSFSAPGTGTFLPGEKASPFSGKKQQINEEPEMRFETIVTKARLDDALRALRATHPYEEAAFDIVRLDNLDPAVGLGVRGTLETPMPLGDFAAITAKALGVSHVRIVGKPARRVRSVAVLGGSGGGEISRIPADIDVYVTGDVNYHQACAAHARGLAVIDAGHAGTEACIVPVIAAYLRGHFPGIAVHTWREPERFQVADLRK